MAQPEKTYLEGHTRWGSDSHWGRATLQQAQIPRAKRLLRISDILVMIVPSYIISGQEIN